MQPTPVQQRVIDRINREIGKDVGNLYKSKSLIESYSQLFVSSKAKVCCVVLFVCLFYCYSFHELAYTLR